MCSSQALTTTLPFPRFTIHTIEDLRKELNRRANVSTTDQVPRPNSPEDTRSYPVTPGRDVATPLIFNSGGLHSTSDEFMSRRPQVRPLSNRYYLGHSLQHIFV